MNGIVTTFDEQDGKLIVNRSQDVEGVLEENKRLLTADDGWSETKDMRRAASIPLVIVEQWLREGVDIFDPNCAGEVRRRLNSSDWAHLRTAEGVI